MPITKRIQVTKTITIFCKLMICCSWQDTNESIGQYLTILVEFVQAMKEKLKAYNEDRRTLFQLRAGLRTSLLLPKVSHTNSKIRRVTIKHS